MRSTHCWLAVKIHRPFLYYVGKCTVIVLILLWSLLEVHSQPEYPYVSFMGDILPNHAYVDLTTVGDDITASSGDTVRCQTNLQTCCTSNQGSHRGDWYFPDGSVLPHASNPGGSNIVEDREPQEVHLRRRNNAMSPTGIYHCVIETVAVHADVIDTITGETVYVGLYLPSEGTCAEFPCTSIQRFLVIICP